MDNSTIVILNGTSCSGKTSIAKELQAANKKPVLHVSIDNYIVSFPRHLWNFANIKQPTFDKIVSAFHHSILTYAKLNCFVVVDMVYEKRAWLEECATLLENYDTYLIGVKCDIDEANRRLKVREDFRNPNIVNHQYPIVHDSIDYDYVIDTTEISARSCTEKVIAYLQQENEPKAMAIIRAVKA